jgi:DNA excision repair protein ERCC-4
VSDVWYRTDNRWLLEYDSTTFASYVNTLQRQHFRAEKLPGAGRHVHDWFNAKAAATLVDASQGRVSRKALRMDNERDDSPPFGSTREEPVPGNDGVDDDELEAMREAESGSSAINGEDVVDAEGDEVMMEFATQQEVQQEDTMEEDTGDDADDTLKEISATAPPPVFRPMMLSLEEDLSKRVESRLRKGHEPVLEEQPKWSLMARVLKEIEDTIARVSTTHASKPFDHAEVRMGALTSQMTLARIQS